MELRHLRYFIAVAEESSITKAARTLGIAQPPLSAQIAKMEREFDTALFIRNPRGVTLTGGGRLLLEEARRLLSRANEIRRAVKATELGVQATLRIGCVPSGTSSVLLDCLPRFHADYPEIMTYVYEMEATSQVKAFARGDIDVGLQRTRRKYAGLRLEILRYEDLLAAVPASHRLAAKQIIDPRDLASDPFVMFPRASAPEAFDLILSLCNQHDFSPEIVHEVSNDHSLVSLVAAGLGVSIIPQSTAILSVPGIEYRALSDHGHQAVMSFLSREEPTHSVSIFRDYLRKGRYDEQ